MTLRHTPRLPGAGLQAASSGVSRLFRSTRCAYALAAVTLAAMSPAAARADESPQATATERFRWSGEQFFYGIEILDSEAARCAIAIGQPTVLEDGTTVIPLDGLTISVGFFANVYPMEDSALTRLDLADGLPVDSTKIINERGSVRQYDVVFNHDTYRSDIERFADGDTRRMMRLIPSDTHDAITWMLDLRSRDMSVGASYVYHVFDGWKLSRLTARIEGHTEIYTNLGILEVAEMRFTREVLASFHPLPFANDLVTLPPVYTVTEGPAELGVGWFSLDDRRLPVGVDIETPIGHLRMMLDRWEPPT